MPGPPVSPGIMHGVPKLEIYFRGLQLSATSDCTIIRLNANLDGQYLQFFTATVTGLDVATALAGSDVPEESFWRAAIEEAVEQVRPAIESGRVPRRPPIDACELAISPTDIMQRAGGDHRGPPLAGELLRTIEL